MTLKDIKDKLEIGLKPDAPYRPGNRPGSEQPHAPHAPGTDPDPDDRPGPKSGAGKPGRVRDRTR